MVRRANTSLLRSNKNPGRRYSETIRYESLQFIPILNLLCQNKLCTQLGVGNITLDIESLKIVLFHLTEKKRVKLEALYNSNTCRFLFVLY